MLRRVLIVEAAAAEARALVAALDGREFLLRVEETAADALECLAAWRPECALIGEALGRPRKCNEITERFYFVAGRAMGGRVLLKPG